MWLALKNKTKQNSFNCSEDRQPLRPLACETRQLIPPLASNKVHKRPSPAPWGCSRWETWQNMVRPQSPRSLSPPQRKVYKGHSSHSSWGAPVGLHPTPAGLVLCPLLSLCDPPPHFRSDQWFCTKYYRVTAYQIQILSEAATLVRMDS